MDDCIYAFRQRVVQIRMHCKIVGLIRFISLTYTRDPCGTVSLMALYALNNARIVVLVALFSTIFQNARFIVPVVQSEIRGPPASYEHLAAICCFRNKKKED